MERDQNLLLSLWHVIGPMPETLIMFDYIDGI